jgi:hypothetical protein
MALKAFDAAIKQTCRLSPDRGAERKSRDSHASIHDDATAQKLGFQLASPS